MAYYVSAYGRWDPMQDHEVRKHARKSGVRWMVDGSGTALATMERDIGGRVRDQKSAQKLVAHLKKHPMVKRASMHEIKDDFAAKHGQAFAGAWKTSEAAKHPDYIGGWSDDHDSIRDVVAHLKSKGIRAKVYHSPYVGDSALSVHKDDLAKSKQHLVGMLGKEDGEFIHGSLTVRHMEYAADSLEHSAKVMQTFAAGETGKWDRRSHDAMLHGWRLSPATPGNVSDAKLFHKRLLEHGYLPSPGAGTHHHGGGLFIKSYYHPAINPGGLRTSTAAGINVVYHAGRVIGVADDTTKRIYEKDPTSD